MVELENRVTTKFENGQILRSWSNDIKQRVLSQIRQNVWFFCFCKQQQNP